MKIIKKIIILISGIILSFSNYYKENIKDNTNVINNIYIEKINLKENFLSYEESNVDNGIIYLKESDFNRNFYILAAHSGNSSISYFKNIHRLEKGDVIILNIGNKKNKFIVTEKYYVEKNGKIILKKNLSNTLYLTTCDKYNNNRQLIIKSVNNM